jgi:hypothetical protein
MHELRVNATRGGHPPSPAASDVVSSPEKPVRINQVGTPAIDTRSGMNV